jgi:hypothetical protein
MSERYATKYELAAALVVVANLQHGGTFSRTELERTRITLTKWCAANGRLVGWFGRLTSPKPVGSTPDVVRDIERLLA